MIAMKSCGHKAGVTLIELLIVLAVIVMLSALVVGVGSRIYNQSKEEGLKSALALLEASLQEYREFTGDFPIQPEINPVNAAAHSQFLYGELNGVPSSREVLEKIDGSLIKNEFGAAATPSEIYDPWGVVLDYVYVNGQNFPTLISAGPDKAFGTADDIRSK